MYKDEERAGKKRCEMQDVIGDYSRIEQETVKSINNNNKNIIRGDYSLTLQNLPLSKYPATSTDLELRSRETKLNM